jgi:hypothetical protein
MFSSHYVNTTSREIPGLVEEFVSVPPVSGATRLIPPSGRDCRWHRVRRAGESRTINLQDFIPQGVRVEPGIRRPEQSRKSTTTGGGRLTQ